MEAAAANAMYADLHEKRPYHDGTFSSWSAKRSRSHPYHFNDGVTISAARVDLSPDDEFLNLNPVDDVKRNDRQPDQ
jgi:hypothetical protein